MLHAQRGDPAGRRIALKYLKAFICSTAKRPNGPEDRSVFLWISGKKLRSAPFQTLAFALSQRAVKAVGSFMAVSESIFLFISIPAALSPCMKVE